MGETSPLADELGDWLKNDEGLWDPCQESRGEEREVEKGRCRTESRVSCVYSTYTCKCNVCISVRLYPDVRTRGA